MLNLFEKLPENEEGIFKQFVVAEKGHKEKVIQAYVAVARCLHIKDARLLAKGVGNLLPMFFEQGFLEGKATADGKRLIVAKRAVLFEQLSIHQMLASFATVQLAIGNAFDELVFRDLTLLTKLQDQRLCFRSNDPEVVMTVVCKILRMHGAPGMLLPPDDYDDLLGRFNEIVHASPQLAADPAPVEEVLPW